MVFLLSFMYYSLIKYLLMYSSPRLIRHYNLISRHSAICVGRMRRCCIDMHHRYKLLDDL